MYTVYIKDDETLDTYLAGLRECPLDEIVAVAETDKVEKFMLQPLVRQINGRAQTFLSLRNIKINPNLQRQGIFKGILKRLIDSGHPLLLDDVINSNLEAYLQREGWIQLKTKKYGEDVVSYYLPG